jgi:hypothetical protein
MKPHWEALKPTTRESFYTCAKFPFIDKFYLAGGTGLALHFGHRYSVDLDFFSEKSNTVDAAMRSLLKRKLQKSSLEVIHDKDATFVAKWRGVGIIFLN